MTLRRFALALLPLLLLAACTGAGETIPDSPTLRPETPQAPAAAQGPLIAPPDLAAPQGELEVATFTTLRQGLEERALPAPEQLDPLLSRAARVLAEAAPTSSGPLGAEEIRGALEIAGAFDAFVHAEVLLVDDAAAELPPSAEALSDFLDVSADRTVNVLGVAWAPRAGGPGGALVLLSAYRAVELEPTPRQADAQGVIHLKGRLLERDATLSLVTRGDDPKQASRTPVEPRADGRFSIDLTLPTGAAALDVELVGTGAAWGRSFASLRIHRGAPPTTLEAALAARVEQRPADAAQAEAALRQRINQRRELLGLEALALNPGLEVLARQDAMMRALEQPYPRGEETAEGRLKRFGVAAEESRYLTASDNAPDRLMEAVWSDPVLRKRLLDPSLNQLGLALTENPPQASRRYTLVAYGVRSPYKTPPERDIQAILEILNTQRGQRTAQPLELHGALDPILNKHAYPALVRGKPDPKLTQRILDEVRAADPSLKNAAVSLGIASSVDALKLDPNLLNSNWSRAAIAVARGNLGKKSGEVVVAIIVVME